jgi:hypothetical protein
MSSPHFYENHQPMIGICGLSAAAQDGCKPSWDTARGLAKVCLEHEVEQDYGVPDNTPVDIEIPADLRPIMGVFA